MNNQNREHWGSRIGVILAVSASAVGLGNFLRFPGLAARYGGGAFMVPYFISLLIIGIPICWCEWTLGRYGGRCGYNSVPGIFRSITHTKRYQYVGAVGMMIPLFIYMYYTFIESWCLAYAWFYLSGALNQLSGQEPGAFIDFFVNYAGLERHGILLENPFNLTLFFLVIAFVLNFFLIYLGVSKGIENFCKVAMPLLIVAAVITLIRVLTLGTPDPTMPERNVSNGLGFMWNIKLEGDQSLWNTLLPWANPEIWLAAAGQIFFSLSVGFGLILTYASYLRPKDDVVLSGLTASATNEFCEVCLAGLITVPAAFIFLGGDAITQADGSSLKLGFFTLPAVIDRMPIGNLFGFVWFFLLFLAALSSSISMLQPGIAFLEEGFGLRRRASVCWLGLITLIGVGFVVVFSQNLIALDTMDFWIGQVLIFVMATILVLMFGWVIGIDAGFEEAHRGAHIRIPGVFKFVIKYVSPIYLLGIFFLFIRVNIMRDWSQSGSYAHNLLHHRDAQLTFLFVLAVAVVFFVLVYFAGKRWDNLEQKKSREQLS